MLLPPLEVHVRRRDFEAKRLHLRRHGYELYICCRGLPNKARLCEDETWSWTMQRDPEEVQDDSPGANTVTPLVLHQVRVETVLRRA